MNRMLTALATATLLGSHAVADVTVKATNTLDFARPSQTIELAANDLASLEVKDLSFVHVKDEAGKELLAQAVDTDFDLLRRPDILIFQADFGPRQTKTFILSAGRKQTYDVDDFKAYGRFVRERYDDFAWENDRVAFRTYGKALQASHEKLTSSSIDIWSKRTSRLVLNDWYMHGNYHADHGEGADFYSAGPTMGCGGSGLWLDGKLWLPENHVNSRVLAAGPIRVLFELDFAPFVVGPMKVSGVRRISLDAGQNLNQIVATFTPAEPGTALTAAVGLKKTPNDHATHFNREHGWLTKFEDVEKNQGRQGLAVIIDQPELIRQRAEDENNLFLLTHLPENGKLSYRAGFYWDKADHFEDYEAWKTYVDQQSQAIASPIQVVVSQ